MSLGKSRCPIGIERKVTLSVKQNTNFLTPSIRWCYMCTDALRVIRYAYFNQLLVNRWFKIIIRGI